VLPNHNTSAIMGEKGPETAFMMAGFEYKIECSLFDTAGFGANKTE